MVAFSGKRTHNLIRPTFRNIIDEAQKKKLVLELVTKQLEASAAQMAYQRFVEKGKDKLRLGIEHEDLWTYFCMARLCAGTHIPVGYAGCIQRH